MHYKELDTPSLIIDKDIMLKNLQNMQKYADYNKVGLRPHTKTHKSSYLAQLQIETGAIGIAVAKVGEAEVMASKGIDNILIANEIVGEKKLKRIVNLSKSKNIVFGVDSIPQLVMIQQVFSSESAMANIVVEIEVGENRSGIIETEDFKLLLNHMKTCSNICFKGVFSHDGNSYSAKDKEECLRIHLESQIRTLEFASIAKSLGFENEIVSIGSTPSLINDFPILDGITEIRPGTYIFMDAAQGNGFGSFMNNAAFVTTTVISKPTKQRVITDVGAKGLTMQTRSNGFTKTTGLGIIKGIENAFLEKVYDEHGIIYNQEVWNKVEVGDVLEIIPNHICPVVNLYDSLFLISNETVEKEIIIDCRGKLK